MKSNLIIVAAALVAALAGYFVGSYRTAQTWKRIVEGQIDRCAHTEVKNRGEVNLQVLNYLHDGKQSEATQILEGQLDVAVIRCAAYWNAASPDDRDGQDMMIIRRAQDYRSHHPWTNDHSDIFENVQTAFKLSK